VSLKEFSGGNKIYSKIKKMFSIAIWIAIYRVTAAVESEHARNHKTADHKTDVQKGNRNSNSNGKGNNNNNLNFIDHLFNEMNTVFNYDSNSDSHQNIKYNSNDKKNIADVKIKVSDSVDSGNANHINHANNNYLNNENTNGAGLISGGGYDNAKNKGLQTKTNLLDTLFEVENGGHRRLSQQRLAQMFLLFDSDVYNCYLIFSSHLDCLCFKIFDDKLCCSEIDIIR